MILRVEVCLHNVIPDHRKLFVRDAHKCGLRGNESSIHRVGSDVYSEVEHLVFVWEYEPEHDWPAFFKLGTDWPDATFNCTMEGEVAPAADAPPAAESVSAVLEADTDARDSA